MNNIFSAQLKKLRKEKGNTQEEFASVLLVTPQAVSKWERGEGLPDIAHLPVIASYYGTTVDDLLGAGVERRKARVKQYQERASKEMGNAEKCLSVWEEAYRELPGENKVRLGLAGALLHKCICTMKIDGSGANWDAKERIVKLVQDVISSPNLNNELLASADAILVSVYSNTDERDKAIEIAKRQITYGMCKEEVLLSALDPDKRPKQALYCIAELYVLIFQKIYFLALDAVKRDDNLHDMICRLDAILNIGRSLFPRNDYGAYYFVPDSVLWYKAQIHMAAEDMDGAMDCLSEWVDININFIERGNDILVAPLLGGKFDCLEEGDERLVRNKHRLFTRSPRTRLADFELPGLEKIREHPRFAEIRKRFADAIERLDKQEVKS